MDSLRHSFYLYIFCPYTSYRIFLNEMLAISLYKNSYEIAKLKFVKNLLMIKIVHMIVLVFIAHRLDVPSRIANYEYSFHLQNNSLRDFMFVVIFIQAAHNQLRMILVNSYQLTILNRELVLDKHENILQDKHLMPSYFHILRIVFNNYEPNETQQNCKTLPDVKFLKKLNKYFDKRKSRKITRFIFFLQKCNFTALFRKLFLLFSFSLLIFLFL